MYASFYELFDAWFGIKFGPLKIVHTFGALMAISFLAAAWALNKELRRKENEGLLKPTPKQTWVGKGATAEDLIEPFLVAFVLFFKLIYIIFNFNEFKADAQGTLLSLKGNILGGIIAGAVYAYFSYREKEKGKLAEPKLETIMVHPYQLVGNITLIAAIGGILGAKLFDALENYQEFFQDPAMIFSSSGLTIYGGLIVGAISVLVYTHKKGIPLLHMVDAAAPSMILAYAVGRVGCQMAGDGDWGIVNTNPKPSFLGFLPDWMWSFSYPHNVEHAGIPIPGCTGDYCTVLSPGVYPTPFYETIMGLIIFFILWKMRKKIIIPGVLFCWYLVFNGIERFSIELIRVNIKYHFFGMEATQAQLISPMFFLLGVIGIFYFTNKAKKNAQRTT
jgi:phosphatidylglycerol---prolipoprotein diacylglyceryl transferase